MQPESMNSVLQYLRRTVLLHDADGLTDGQLLETFLAQHEDAAFTALVRRHGSMVFGVCRRVLGNRHDAEDAFQAVFLVLLRKAATIRPRQAVGHWLYGVAYRTALRARSALARRRAKERQAGQTRQEKTSENEADWRPLLDEELSRLPEKYRAPIVLCDLQGRTHKEAARELGWPQGTLSGRLWRARALLAQRLSRRGLALSATVLTLACAEDSALASVTAPLIQASTKVARMFVEGGSATVGEMSTNVAVLAQGVLKAMYLTKLKIAAAVLLAASLGMGAFLYAPGAQAEPRAEEKASSPPVDSTASSISKLPAMPTGDAPTAKQLIDYLNANARRIPALRCTNVAIDMKEGRAMVGLAGKFLYQKPGQVRLTAKVFGKPALDLGSNGEEVWYCFGHNDPPYVFWISRADLASDTSRWPLPFSPDWLGEVLGIAERDANKRREVVIKTNTIELTEPTRTPQGQPASKLTVFARAQSPIQVMEHRLLDNKGKMLCQAVVGKMRQDVKTQALLVQDVKIIWPAQRLEVRLRFNDLDIVEPMNREGTFTPKNLTAPRFSLAAGRLDKKKDESKPLLSDGPIQIDLANAHIEMRCREETLKISGQPNSTLSLQVLKDQLHTWIAVDGKSTPHLRIACEASVEHGRLKAVLDACRQAGIRKIELQTNGKTKGK